MSLEDWPAEPPGPNLTHQGHLSLLCVIETAGPELSGLLIKMVTEVNALFTSSHDQIRITTTLQTSHHSGPPEV